MRWTNSLAVISSRAPFVPLKTQHGLALFVLPAVSHEMHHTLLLARHKFAQAHYRGRPRAFQCHGAIQATHNLGEARPLALNVERSKVVDRAGLRQRRRCAARSG